MVGPAMFRVLNREREAQSAKDWDRRDWEALWVYNLHYFDDLNAADSTKRIDWHKRLITRWLNENPPGRGRGWDPYPTSLRLVNWIKWLWQGNQPVEGMIESLAVQARWLQRRIEYHLLGNHLLANAKALVFAGLAFDGVEAEAWHETGWRLLDQQLAEQILPDGGHFELSPMYHAIILEDLLDLLNARPGLPRENAVSRLSAHASRALGWLDALVDERGGFPLLNDATDGVAPTLAMLREYAERLGVHPDMSGLATAAFVNGWTGRSCSGYWVIDGGPLRMWFDTAPIGPDYQPGHAHGDMLSVQLTLAGQPVLTDTGVSTYELGAQRAYERSTAAHNTVRIDALDQAEFWASFRVARRGHPVGFRLMADGLECGHDGFAVQRRGLHHRRVLRLHAGGFTVTDVLTGPGQHSFEVVWHIAPGTSIERLAPGRFGLEGKMRVEIEGGECVWGESCYCREFGVVRIRPCLTVSGMFSGKTQVKFKCTYCY